ncbi:MAG TPA: HAMP domain-containing protein, partial [Egibacteraceae bacterium]|nr:HAMP domain-containing protein [Egibacteraceae bacterium]
MESSHSDGARSRWRRRLASARLRIVGWHLLLLAAALALSIVTVRTILLVRLDERIDRELRQEADEVRSLAVGADPATGEPFEGDVARILEVFLRRNVPARNEVFVTYLDGRPYLRSAGTHAYRFDLDGEFTRRWGRTSDSDRGTLLLPDVGSVAYHALPLRVDSETRAVFVSAWFRDIEAAEINQIVWIVTAIGGVALLLASAIVWNVTGRVLRPVSNLAATARQISGSDLSQRIDVRGSDEIAELAHTFNAMLDRLESGFDAQRQFVNDAGHELRTPITIIRGHLELLEVGDATDRKATVELVTDELDRMHRMVEDMLLLAKAQRPDFLRLDTVRVSELTNEVFAKATAIAPRAWALSEVGEGALRGDRQRLTQALVQLAQNAVQHTAAGDRIVIGSSVEEGAAARLWISDSGPGVAPVDKERIFARFARGGDNGRGDEGAGLGLAIVKAIAEAH